MAPAAPPDPRAAGRAVADEVGFARKLLRRVGPRLLVSFAFIALSLWGFGELAEEVLQGEPFAFDEPLLAWGHGWASARADAFFLFFSAIGYASGVVPADVLLTLALVIRRRFREATFAGFATAGSGLLNVAAKRSFQRDRPSLWDSIAPETTFSFPSGHAMGSMTLGCVLVLLAWPTRLRWPVLAAAAVFVTLVGASRVYLGVHYPSDILAGWAAAIAWVAVVYVAVFRKGRRPWRAPPSPPGVTPRA